MARWCVAGESTKPREDGRLLFDYVLQPQVILRKQEDC